MLEHITVKLFSGLLLTGKSIMEALLKCGNAHGQESSVPEGQLGGDPTAHQLLHSNPDGLALTLG